MDNTSRPEVAFCFMSGVALTPLQVTDTVTDNWFRFVIKFLFELEILRFFIYFIPFQLGCAKLGSALLNQYIQRWSFQLIFLTKSERITK
jgi:hypothetical protein